jgi:hypothetical protein
MLSFLKFSIDVMIKQTFSLRKINRKSLIYFTFLKNSKINLVIGIANLKLSKFILYPKLIIFSHENYFFFKGR